MTEVLLSTEFDRVLVKVGPYEKEFKISKQHKHSSHRFYGGFDAKYLNPDCPTYHFGYESVAVSWDNLSLEKFFIMGDVFHDPIQQKYMSFFCVLVDEKTASENLTDFKFVFLDKLETLELFREAKSYFEFPGMYSISSFNEVEQLLETFTKVESSTLNTRLSSLKVAS